jgi:lipopolysaccharide transport protein LptA
MRVAADRIRTDPSGRELEASGRVEASLLGGEATARAPLFSADEAIHFVSDELDAADGGMRMTFRGSVRGWQRDRSLAADTVNVDRTAGTIVAEEHVATRVPRVADGGAREADHVLVTADRLTYDEASAVAHYAGGVRVRVAEGWMEAGKVDVRVAREGGAIEELRASEAVELELRSAESGEPVVGRADELVYRPADESVVLLGHDAPAEARQADRATLGRVLTYHLDDGTMQVQSGASGTARLDAAPTVPPPAESTEKTPNDGGASRW